MTNNVVLMTKAEAIKHFPFGRRGLESLIKKGELGFKIVNGRYYFLESEINRWANDLQYHTDCTKEVTSTGRTSQSRTTTEQGLGLGKLLELRTLEKLKNTASKELRAYNKKPTAKPQVSLQA